MLILKLAIRNILGAGLRTWLNVVSLSFAFVTIIFMQGFYEGMNDQAEQASINALYGSGQYWQKKYDPFDPLMLTDAHAEIPAELVPLVRTNEVMPILIRQATIYPQGRFRTVLLKGIDPDQNIVSIPSSLLHTDDGTIPALIGTRMAKSTGLHKGDALTVQWRDVHGTFDARDVTIVDVFKTSVQEVDNNQFWVPLAQLQAIMGMPHEATIIVLSKIHLHIRSASRGLAGGQTVQQPIEISGWEFKNLNFLLRDLHALVRSKTIGGSILYSVLLFLAMLAIFDTQVLSIWRRRKEIGTLMAMGMTRTSVIGLFTLEGGCHGILAAVVGALYGIPLLVYAASIGFGMPEAVDSVGFAIGERIFPVYSAGLIIGTTILVSIVTTIVSFLPSRRIAKLKPTDALRGKMT